MILPYRYVFTILILVGSVASVPLVWALGTLRSGLFNRLYPERFPLHALPPTAFLPEALRIQSFSLDRIGTYELQESRHDKASTCSSVLPSCLGR